MIRHPFIRVSDDMKYLIISRSDFIYPDGKLCNDELCALLDNHDGDIILPFGSAQVDAKHARKMIDDLFWN